MSGAGVAYVFCRASKSHLDTYHTSLHVPNRVYCTKCFSHEKVRNLRNVTKKGKIGLAHFYVYERQKRLLAAIAPLGFRVVKGNGA